MAMTQTVQFSSRWYLYSWKGPYALHSVSQKFPQRCLWISSSVWLMKALSRPFEKIVYHFLFPCLSPPGDQWCYVLGIVPAGNVSSSSTLQLFWDARHMWALSVWHRLIPLFISQQRKYLFFVLFVCLFCFLIVCLMLFSGGGQDGGGDGETPRSTQGWSLLPCRHHHQCYPRAGEKWFPQRADRCSGGCHVTRPWAGAAEHVGSEVSSQKWLCMWW